MPTISKKEYEEYKSLCYDRDHGRILTPDGLIIRVADDEILPSEYIQAVEEITLDML